MRDVVVTLLQRLAPHARRPEALLEPGWLDRVLAVRAELNDRAEIGHVARLTEGGQGHHLVFIGGVQEAQILGDLRVKRSSSAAAMTLPSCIRQAAES